MSKRYILTGDPKEVQKVIQENRIRINRGVISITPVEPETEETNLHEEVPTGLEDGSLTEENVPTADDKNIEVEDMKEVNLDEDDKTIVTDDSKDVPEIDSKETESGKTSKRNKKPE